MSRIIISASVPAPLGERLREVAAAADRTVSYVLGRLLEQALLNDNGAPVKDAVVKIDRAGPTDEQ